VLALEQGVDLIAQRNGIALQAFGLASDIAEGNKKAYQLVSLAEHSLLPSYNPLRGNMLNMLHGNVSKLVVIIGWRRARAY
jgi:hypothetical protein